MIGFENVFGGTISDSIVGSGGANGLNGGGGGDQLCGLGGRDVLTGGSGADTFVFLTLADSGIKASTRDVITDFVAASGDIVDVSAIDATHGNAAGDPLFNVIGLTPFSGARGELEKLFSSGETIISGDANGDGKTDFSIALTGFVLLSGGDFHL